MLALLIPVVGVIAIRLLQNRWGYDSVVDVLHHAVSGLLPTFSTTPQATVRKVGRRLNGVKIACANGAPAAAGHLRVHLGATTWGALADAYPLAILSEEHVAAYRSNALAQGWRIPLGPITLEFVIDHRMRPGWVRIDAIPGTYPLEARAGRVPELASEPLAVTRVLGDDALPTVKAIGPVWRLVPLSDGPSLDLITSDEAIVGRGSDADLIVSDKHVSRRHACIARAGGHLVVRDLGSTNGTFVDGIRVGPDRPVNLKPGAMVAFGGRGLVYELVEAE